MATRSRIGLQLADGSVLSAYSHWDGYPEWMGRILRTHYNSKEKAAELIDGGDMSSPWTTSRWTREGATEVATFGPEYYSERGENCPPRLDESLSEYLMNGEEYGYVYTQEEGWLCYNTRSWDEAYLEGVEIPAGALAA